MNALNYTLKLRQGEKKIIQKTEYIREKKETSRHQSLAAGCVRAQDASLCFKSVVSLRSSSSLLGNKNILVFPPNDRSGGSQMCGRGGGGGGSSPLRLNWGAGRRGPPTPAPLLQEKQPTTSPFTSDPSPLTWGMRRGGKGCGELRECKQPIGTCRVTLITLWPCWHEAKWWCRVMFLYHFICTCCIYIHITCMWGQPSPLLILPFLPPWGNWENCVSHLFQPAGRWGGEYHQSFRDLARDHRLTWRSWRSEGGGGGGEGHGYEP